MYFVTGNNDDQPTSEAIHGNVNDYDFDDSQIDGQNPNHGQNPNNDQNQENNANHGNENEPSTNSHNQNEIIDDTVMLTNVSKWETNEEIQIIREYLRIATVHPDIDYSKMK